MVRLISMLATATAILSTTLAQSLNTDPNCAIYINPAGDQTLYFAPDNTRALAIYAAGFHCDAGSVAPVSIFLRDGTRIANCDNLVLNGNYNKIECPLVRGTVASADSPYQWYFFASEDTAAYAEYSYTHDQVTVAADTPTTTVTTTPTSVVVETTTTTTPQTFTSPQSTVTDPAATAHLTRAITPHVVTRTVTNTKTLTGTKTIFKIKSTTKTIAAPCKTPVAVPCKSKKTSKRPYVSKDPSSKKPSSPKKHARDFITPDGAATLAKREDIGPDGVEGDGPLTTTTTPAPVIATETADTVTSTVTNTETTGTPTTVPPTSLTTTVFAGTATVVATTTQRARTTTVTKCKYASTKTTKTVTKTWTATKKVTGVCKVKPTKKSGY